MTLGLEREAESPRKELRCGVVLLFKARVAGIVCAVRIAAATGRRFCVGTLEGQKLGAATSRPHRDRTDRCRSFTHRHHPNHLSLRPIAISHARRLWARFHLAALHRFHRQPADLRSAFYELQPDHVIPGGALCNLQSACKIG